MFIGCAVSSVVEHYLDTVGVAGSNPASRTIPPHQQRPARNEIAMNQDRQRKDAVHGLTGETLDVLIIGGGIVGSGIARDAAMRGLKTALIEQHDFAFGTSSRSSRLLHGGLRYLPQGRVGLVREASVEKKIIHKIAPHLVQPLPFIFPTYTGNKHWRLWQLKIGVKIYDLLCRGRNLGQSTWLTAQDVQEKVPSLTQTNLTGAVRYFDGFTNDARLVLDTLRSAAKAGAQLLNYCQFKDAAQGNNGRARHSVRAAGSTGNDGAHGVTRPTLNIDDLWHCEAEDILTGQRFQIRARTIVNATGPWAGGLPHSAVKLRVTKGIHLVVNRSRVPVPDTVVMTEGRRILFAIPWGDRTILGTTDTDYNGPLDQVTADVDDIGYVLQITNQFFPSAKLTSADVISTWAGLRPLLADPNGNPSDISRTHEINNPEPGWWDVAGGKLTTYRLMAEQTVDQLVEFLLLRNEVVGQASRLSSGGSECEPGTPVLGGSHRTGGTPVPLQGWREFAACRTAADPLLPAAETQNISGILPPEFCRRVVEHYCTNEWAVHLDDVMVRRTGWHHYYADAAQKAGHVADWMSELLGWSDAQHNDEFARYRELTRCSQEATRNSARQQATMTND